MSKKVKIIVVISIILIVFLLGWYKDKVNKDENLARKENTNYEVTEVKVIDKHNRMKELYDKPEKEEYVIVDIIIDGNYYTDVGIRTKGNVIYKTLKVLKLENYSFKVKLDYINTNQRYKGMSELHLNSTFYDSTGIREYLVYHVYNKMGIQTQQYYLGHLEIDDLDRGLITIVEVINEDYVEYKYDSKDGNLYKPEPISDASYVGADLRYSGEDKEKYSGILNNTKTINTSIKDKERLIGILKNINTSSYTEVIEENFMDFDKIIKMVAINKVIGNVDVFTSRNLRNFCIYEENGKIDILTFDFDISFNPNLNRSFWTDDMDELDLSKSDVKIYSRITDIIIENEEYTKRYYYYVEQTQKLLREGNILELVESLHQKTKSVIYNNDKKIYSYNEYLKKIPILKEFITQRGEKIEKKDTDERF